MEKHREITKQGFTLVEMLVSVLVFSIIIGSIFGMLVLSIKNQRMFLSQQTVLDQISFVTEYISRTLRMAIKEFCIDGCTCFSEEYKNYEISPDGSEIRFINSLQNNDCQAFFFEDGKIKLKTDLDTTNPKIFELTSDNITITFLRFHLSGGDQTDNLQPRITFYLEATGKEGQPKIKMQSSISQRMLDVNYAF